MTNRSTLLNLFVLALVTLTLAACGDTWEGVKQDTGENLEATGEAIEDAGEAVSGQ
jgi:predicted small secreted protein